MSLKFRPISEATLPHCSNKIPCTCKPSIAPTPLLNPRPSIRLQPQMRNQKAKKLEPATQQILDLSARNMADSPLLSLPVDVRRRIYEYVFTTGGAVELVPLDACFARYRIAASDEEEEGEGKGNAVDMDIDDMVVLHSRLPTATDSRPRNPFASLLTCRQVYLEAHLLPFYLNTIHCTTIWDLATILRRLSPAQVSCIRVLKIRWATAQAAVQESTQRAEATRKSWGPVRLALGMLDGLERVVVDGAGRRRFGMERKRAEEALGALCGGELDVVFECGGEGMCAVHVVRRVLVGKA